MVRILAVLLLLVVGANTASTAPNTFSSDVQMCSGRPWIDVTCNGADPTGVADSTTAIQTTITSAVSNDWPVFFPSGTYKVTSKITVEYGGQAANGPQIISQAAFIDGRTISSGNVLAIQCSGGTPAAPILCQHMGIQGWLTVWGSGAGYVVTIGKTDFSDRHNSVRIEHLVARNSGTGGGIQANYLTDGDLWFSGTTQGGSANIGAVALEQVQSSKIGGLGSTTNPTTPGLLIENGGSINNNFIGFAYDSSDGLCISITSPTSIHNAWLAPYLPCATAVNAPTGGNANALIGPTFLGAAPTSPGISIIGRGTPWHFKVPTVSSITLSGIDDGLILSSANATGPSTQFTAASLPVTLPDPVQVGAGWSAAFFTDSNKAVVITAPGNAKIFGRNQQLSTLTVGAAGSAQNYQLAVLQSDGVVGFRIIQLSQLAAQLNGMQIAFPSTWYFPGGPGYQLTGGDNGGVVSSGATVNGLSVTLPATAGLPPGWMIGLVADAKPLTLSGASMWIAPGAETLSMTLPIGELVWIQYDGALFRFIHDMSRPEVDPMSFGAKADGVTDDSAAIQAAINFLGSNGIGGTVKFRRSPNHYCVKNIISSSVPAITLDGQNDGGGPPPGGQGPVILDACGADTSILDLFAIHNKIVNLKILGSQVPNTSKAAVNLTGFVSGCDECTIEDSQIQFGSYNVYANAYQVHLLNSSFDHAYRGAAVFFTKTGGYMRKDKLDQAYPYGNVPPPSATYTTWQPSTHYNAQDLVINGIQTLQAMTSGTSGGGAPALVPYNTDVSDGGVTWRLNGGANQVGVQIDAGAGFSLSIDSTDFSSNFYQAIAMLNSLAGNPPGYVYLSNNTFYGNIMNHIALGSGYGVLITANQFGSCMLNNCTELSAYNPAFEGDLTITGNQFIGNGTYGLSSGVFVGPGVYRTTIVGNTFGGFHTAISIGNGTDDFTIVGNDVGGSTVWGANTIGIIIGVGANGYSIVGNNTWGNAGNGIIRETPIGEVSMVIDAATPQIAVGSHVGLTCSGTPSSSFSSTNGIVTNC